MTSALLLYSYLDPGNDKTTPVWQWVALAGLAVAAVLAVLYALTRFVAWAARR